VAIQTPKGTRDFYPEDQAVQDYIFDKWRQACLDFGYEAYEGPTFEHLELYTGKSGDEIISQLYNFTSKGDVELALRPEMTPTLARLINQKGNQIRKPCKWFSIPRLFRYEKAQKGRLREFFQLNMDILGTDEITAEVDLLLAIDHLLRSFGLTDEHFVMGVSSRRLLAGLLEELEITEPTAVYAALDKRQKVGSEKFTTLLTDAGLSPDNIEFLDKLMASTTLTELKEYCRGEKSLAAHLELETLFNTLSNLGVQSFKLDLNVVRGLAYYTGIVFEVFNKKQAMRAVAGGGRYDDLCQKLGGKAVTGVGFGMGDVVLKDMLEENGLATCDELAGPDFYIVRFDKDVTQCFGLARELRSQGKSVSHNLQGQKIQKQLENASRLGAKYVVFMDSESSTNDQYDMKNLKTGEQSVCALDAISI
tara:strand:+ start:738 stop:2000 length:1263 start_codon:yes stop_codon:yes gene_type:complete